MEVKGNRLFQKNHLSKKNSTIIISVNLILSIKFAEVMLFDYIKTNYNAGEPILLQNIELDMKYDNLCQQIKKLVDKGSLCRYMEGVYYLPKKTVSGLPYTISADKIAKLKYIENKTSRYGCYTGHTLANMMGLSEQVPQVKEIVSNKTGAVTRTVRIGKISYIVRKSTVTITEENVKAVMLLEILKDVDNLSDIHINASKCLKDYISKNRIAKAMVDTLIPNYPLRTYKAIYDMELTGVFT